MIENELVALGMLAGTIGYCIGLVCGIVNERLRAADEREALRRLAALEGTGTAAAWRIKKGVQA
jgi:hypothetical protein